MVELIDNKDPVYYEFTGKGYNIMLQEPNKYGKFQVALALEGPELDKALEAQEKYGLKVKDTLTYPTEDGLKEEPIKHIVVTAKYVDSGKFPRKFIPTKDDQGEIVRDLIKHGADMTIKAKGYSYGGGPQWEAGNAFQLEAVRVHSYEPFVAHSKAASA